MTEIQKNCRSCKHYRDQKCNILLNRMVAYEEDIIWPDKLSAARILKIKEHVQALIIEPTEFSCSNWE